MLRTPGPPPGPAAQPCPCSGPAARHDPVFRGLAPNPGPAACQPPAASAPGPYGACCAAQSGPGPAPAACQDPVFLAFGPSGPWPGAQPGPCCGPAACHDPVFCGSWPNWPGHLRAAWLSGRVRVRAAVRAGDVRHLAGRRAVRPGHRAPGPGRYGPWPYGPWPAGPGPLPGPERAWSRRSGGELALPVACRPVPGLPVPVSRLAGRPRLSLPVGILPWPGPLPGTWPAGTVLAGPRLLGRVLAWAALDPGQAAPAPAGPAAPVAAHSWAGLVSRWLLPVRPRSGGHPGGRLSRPPLRLPGRALSLVSRCLPLAWVPLSRIPGLPCVAGPVRPRGLTRGPGLPGRTRTLARCVRVRPGALRVVEPRRARAARWRLALLARARLARPGACRGRGPVGRGRGRPTPGIASSGRCQGRSADAGSYTACLPERGG